MRPASTTYDTRAAFSRPERLAARVRADGARLVPRIPGYDLLDHLGTGGFGAVYLARQRSTGRQVAVKVLLPRIAAEPGVRDRFRREIEVHARLAHPNVVESYENGAVDELAWFAMEYCDRGSLSSYVRAHGGRLDWEQTYALMDATSHGLAAAHEHGFVHRDVKPHNVLLVGRSPYPLAKLGDFGLARSVAEPSAADPVGAWATAATGHAGSWPYLPREQVLDFAAVGPATDVWSVAATFYQVLTGTPPRPVEPGQDPIAAVLTNEAFPIRSRMPELPPSIAAVFDRALATEPDRRYVDAGEFRQALQAVRP